MELVSVTEAANLLGVSEETVKRRLRRGELRGERRRRPQGYVWLVDLLDESFSTTTHDHSTTTQGDRGDHDTDHNTSGDEGHYLLQEMVEMLQTQVKAQQEQLESKDRQISELHVLLQQAQERVNRMLPPPRRRRWWWPFS